MTNTLSQFWIWILRVVNRNGTTVPLQRQNAFMIESGEDNPFQDQKDQWVTRYTCWICGSGSEKAPLIAPCHRGQSPSEFELCVHSQCLTRRLKVTSGDDIHTAIDQEPVYQKRCPSCLHPYRINSRSKTTTTTMLRVPVVLINKRAVIISSIALYLLFETLRCTEMRAIPGTYFGRFDEDSYVPEYIWLPIVLKTCWRRGPVGWLWQLMEYIIDNLAVILVASCSAYVIYSALKHKSQ